jgi:hypothetical protein
VSTLLNVFCNKGKCSFFATKSSLLCHIIKKYCGNLDLVRLGRSQSKQSRAARWQKVIVISPGDNREWKNDWWYVAHTSFRAPPPHDSLKAIISSLLCMRCSNNNHNVTPSKSSEKKIVPQYRGPFIYVFDVAYVYPSYIPREWVTERHAGNHSLCHQMFCVRIYAGLGSPPVMQILALDHSVKIIYLTVLLLIPQGYLIGRVH